MSEIIIVAETGSDLPQESVDRYDIRLVPMHVTMGGKDYDDRSFPVSDIIDHFARTRELPHTSGSNPQDFATVFDAIHEEHPQAQILYLAYSSVTTVSMESALIAAEGRDYVTTVDTKSVSAGQTLIVERCARFLETHPEATPADAADYVRAQRELVRMAFIPGNLDFLRAGGRVSNGAAIAATLLRLRPVIEILDGRLVATKKLRGSMARSARSLTDLFCTREPMDHSELLLIRAEGLDPRIQQEIEAIVRADGFEDVRWIDTGCVITSHGGPGAFGLAGFATE
ncbi:MAG: DegV family protein [Atopobiaceae bacterium]|nr:DegV family protein [Atopobiaceae bacterium]MCI2173044.1 DegV family protein [Atopobiaceae bacterium]MCI2208137.1 DegV family protein [Atopobiaceae bacterium]